MKPAFFIDRDGVVNVEVNYLCEPEKTELIPGCADAVREIHRAGFMAVVVTNQAGIARGMYGVDDMMSVHARIQRLLLDYGAECTIDGFYFCPHHKDFTGVCECRKPAPGMLLQAAKAFDIDIKNSFMIGDRISDLDAGAAAHCRQSMLVRTGYGCNEVSRAAEKNYPAADDLLAAVKTLLAG